MAGCVLRQAKLTGMVMDIDRSSAISVDNDNNHQNWVNFNASHGARMSANEHLVPEQFFNDPNSTTKNVNGVSAAKALQVAAGKGQKIYTIDKFSINTILPQINHSSEVIQDIQNAVAAGKIVTISQSQVTMYNWTGSGYVILDPTTGAGAYMIGGGANGGFIDFIIANSAALTALTSILSLVGTLAAFSPALIPTLLLIPYFAIGILLITFALSLVLLYATYVDMNERCDGSIDRNSEIFVLLVSVISILQGFVKIPGMQLYGNANGFVAGMYGGGMCQ